MIMNNRRLMLIVVVGLVLGAVLLAGRPPEPTPNVTFDIPAELTSRGTTYISLEIHNRGTAVFPGDVDIHAVMELRHKDLGLLVRQDYFSVREILPGGHLVPGTVRETLPAGRNTFIWGADGYGYVTLDLLIGEENGQLLVIGESKRIRRGVNPPVEPGFGPAEPLVELAIGDLATHLSVPSEMVGVRQISSTHFADASLGLPQPGETYAQVLTPGYIIDLVVSGRSYRYHAGNDRAVLAVE
jgi:hypothetical protein